MFGGFVRHHVSNFSGVHREEFPIQSSNSSAFVNETSSNVSEKIVLRKSLAQTAEAKRAGSANSDFCRWVTGITSKGLPGLTSKGKTAKAIK